MKRGWGALLSLVSYSSISGALRPPICGMLKEKIAKTGLRNSPPCLLRR
jgi:hypothetical protein